MAEIKTRGKVDLVKVNGTPNSNFGDAPYAGSCRRRLT